jgi:hypothetical protein
MYQVIVLLAIAVPVVAFLTYALLRQRKADQVSVRIPSKTNWYK